MALAPEGRFLVGGAAGKSTAKGSGTLKSLYWSVKSSGARPPADGTCSSSPDILILFIGSVKEMVEVDEGETR